MKKEEGLCCTSEHGALHGGRARNVWILDFRKVDRPFHFFFKGTDDKC